MQPHGSMPPRTIRAGDIAATPLRTTRSASRAVSLEDRSPLSDATPSPPKTQAGRAAVSAKSNVPTQPSYAYGSPNKARVPPRLAFDLRTQGLADLLRNQSPAGDAEEAEEETQGLPLQEAARVTNRSVRAAARAASAQAPPAGSSFTRQTTRRSSRLRKSVPIEQLSEEDMQQHADEQLLTEQEDKPDIGDYTTLADTTMASSIRPNDTSASYLAENRISTSAGVLTLTPGKKAVLKVLAVLLLLFGGFFAGGFFAGKTAGIHEKVSLATITAPFAAFQRVFCNPGVPALQASLEIDDLSKRVGTLDKRLVDLETGQMELGRAVSLDQEKRRAHALRPDDDGQSVNFFAPNSGVQVDSYLSSPTREPPSNSFFPRWQYTFLGAPRVTAPGPATAFLPWNDAGDCWCAADAQGRSQLVAVLGRPAIPSALVVEHIPREETLDPGATPHRMQLWVQVQDEERRAELAHFAAQEVGEPDPTDTSDDGGPNALDRSWVLVARGEFDLYGPISQSFTIPKAVRNREVEVRKVAVRTLGNWGSDASSKVDHVCLYRLRLLGTAKTLVSQVSATHKRL